MEDSSTSVAAAQQQKTSKYLDRPHMGFARILQSFYYARIRPRLAKTLAKLWSMVNRNSGNTEVYPKTGTIAAMIGRSERSARRIIAEMIQLGFAKWGPGVRHRDDRGRPLQSLFLLVPASIPVCQKPDKIGRTGATYNKKRMMGIAEGVYRNATAVVADLRFAIKGIKDYARPMALQIPATPPQPVATQTNEIVRTPHSHSFNPSAPQKPSGNLAKTVEISVGEITVMDNVHLTAAMHTLMDHGVNRKSAVIILDDVWDRALIRTEDLRHTVHLIADTFRYRVWSLEQKGRMIGNVAGWFMTALRNPRAYIRGTVKQEARAEREKRDTQRALERREMQPGLILAPPVDNDQETQSETEGYFDFCDKLLAEVNELNSKR